MKEITIEELRRLNDSEGLILQGCGGNLQEWINGINEMLKEGGVLKNNARFTDVRFFQNGKLINLLFLFDNMDKRNMDIGKLALWRISTKEQFGGTWLSDYVPNTLGGFIKQNTDEGGVKFTQEFERPDCSLIGTDGNIFSLLSIATRTLNENGLKKQVKEMIKRIKLSNDYDSALAVIMDYVNPIQVKEYKKEEYREDYDEEFRQIF